MLSNGLGRPELGPGLDLCLRTGPYQLLIQPWTTQSEDNHGLVQAGTHVDPVTSAVKHTGSLHGPRGSGPEPWTWTQLGQSWSDLDLTKLQP
ncbi:hypothetical protein AMTR_s00065p00147030 [Amborella trichopoda]|uniref:Uncharacterized protein n=1 Tax=Amborella trichopoda TaxID=13333 RepID=U5DDX4_AMBTC|nr:hypothetical protein AMTR_s00065p00147030 [Amborella trichopoda]